MDRVANLVKTAGALRRQIWASLPFSLRFAEFFSRLAFSFNEAFGKTIYGEFLTRGIIDGMPDIKGRPASEFDLSKKPVVNRLPSGYGRDFGQKAYGMLLSKVRNPDMVEDLMSDFLVRFLESGSKHLNPKEHRKAAEAYVLQSLQNSLKNWYRSKKTISDIQIKDDEETRYEIPVYDEASVEKQIKRLLPKIKPELERVHPDAPVYIELALDGYSDREIIGDIKSGVPSLLPHPYGGYGKPLTEPVWNSHYKPKIFKVLRDNATMGQGFLMS